MLRSFRIQASAAVDLARVRPWSEEMLGLVADAERAEIAGR